jgi:hypothetical protein
MTRWKAVSASGTCGCALSALLGISLTFDRARAHEPGDFGQYIRGFTIGDPLGALPPPGLYFENTTLYVPGAPGFGQVGGFKANALLDAPTFLWSSGYQFLGATYSAALSQPFYQVDVYPSGLGPPSTGGTLFKDMHNTWVNPATLSWNFKNGWFASVGFDFYIPDGSHYTGTLTPDYWSVQPHASASYLADGWDLTATFLYDIHTASGGTSGSFAGTPVAFLGNGYLSGDQAYLDLTATKKFGKWEIGPVGYFKWQTTADRPGGGFSCATMAAISGLTCGRETDFAVGALVGYDFGPVNLKVSFTDSYYTKDDFGGLFVWTKLSFRLWGPDPPSPSAPMFTKALPR